MTPEDLIAPIAQDLQRVETTMLEVADASEEEWLSSLSLHVLRQPGKRLRPVLTLLAGKAFHYNRDLLVPMAASVELLHTATLVHDDTLDQAAIRRGLSTVNHVWDDTTAVLFGDYVFAASAEMVARTANVRVMQLFAHTLRIICSGELAQYRSAFHCEVTRDQYYHRIGCKTAALFSMATESGAVLGGATEPEVQALKAYGHNLGVAFQIIDDILDFAGDEETLGKPAGSDLAQGTLTLPAILHLEQHPRDNPIRQAWTNGRTPEATRQAINAVRNSKVLDESHRVAATFAAKAREALNTLPDSEAKRSLTALIGLSLTRNA